MSAKRIAVLGLGAMGSRMAERLVDAGHHVTVWNRTAGRDHRLVEKGAARAATPASAVSDADIALSMVRDDAAAREVWLARGEGALAALPRGSVAIESSTVSPDWARAFHAACGTSGIRALDAPVMGSRPQAEAGQLIVLAGGNADLLHEVEPQLRAFAGAVHHAGPAGSGAVVKLLANALFGIQVAALAELLGLSRAGGVDAGRALEILAATPVLSPAAKAGGAGMLAGSFGPMFPVDLVAKDFALALHLARGPLTLAASEVFERARAQGLGGENLTAVAKLYRS
jgi:3-hydroxyisobutyrate dehydrogenase-like beta-hydroxyacid dehydrogenase